MQRGDMLAAAGTRETWDVIVIGGGATGLGSALDAVSRGYRTILLEAHDFAKGTSSRSTKLIHGGVRYLRQGQVQMVRESLLERGRLRRNAPHIVHPRTFVIPAYKPGRRWYFYAGMKAYDFLAGGLGFEPARLLSRSETLAKLPTLRDDNLRGGVQYTDGQFDDARLAISLAQSIVARGGVAINYAPVVRLLQTNGRLTGVVFRDAECGQETEVAGRVIINATGVFGESIMQLDPATADDLKPPRIVASQGTHLVLPQRFLPAENAMLIPHTDDARVLFAIPWLGRTLFGTTDNRVDQVVLEPHAMAGEIEYLLEHATRYLTETVSRQDVLACFSGLRPLVGESGAASASTQRTASLSREHQIYASATGLLTIIGGKWTTYRKMGEEVIDLAAAMAGLKKRPSSTREMPLYGGEEGTQQNSPDAPLAVYGRHRQDVLEAADDANDPGAQSLNAIQASLVGQIRWGVEREMARTVDDVLARRSRLLLLNARAAMAAAEPTARLMQAILQQSHMWRRAQVETFTALAQHYLPQDV